MFSSGLYLPIPSSVESVSLLSAQKELSNTLNRWISGEICIWNTKKHTTKQFDNPKKRNWNTHFHFIHHISHHRHHQQWCTFSNLMPFFAHSTENFGLFWPIVANCVTQLKLDTGEKLSSSIFYCLSVSQSVSEASVSPDQISTFSNIYRHTSPLLTQYNI